MLCCGVWGLPFRLSASSWGKWVASYPAERTKRLRAAISRVQAQSGYRSQQGRDFLAALPGKEVCAGSHPPAGPAQEMRRESQEPGLPGPAAPPRRPSSPVLDCRKRAGGNALPGGWVGEAASAPAPPASQARGGAALSLRQTRRPPPAARRRSRCSLPIGIARRCCSPTLGGRSGEAGSDRRRRPPARSPRRWGWAGEGDLPNPLFWEVRCWT